MTPTPTVVELPTHLRLAAVRHEIHSKKNCFVAEDVLRHQVLIIGARMAAIQSVIEDEVGEPCSLASLYEASALKQRKGRTGSFRVHKLSPETLPAFLDEQRKRYARVVIAAHDPARWHLVDAA